MKIEGYVNGLDELNLGFSMYYGEDEDGAFHCLQLGFLIFTICLYKYLNKI